MCMLGSITGFIDTSCSFRITASLFVTTNVAILAFESFIYIALICLASFATEGSHQRTWLAFLEILQNCLAPELLRYLFAEALSYTVQILPYSPARMLRHAQARIECQAYRRS